MSSIHGFVFILAPLVLSASPAPVPIASEYGKSPAYFEQNSGQAERSTLFTARCVGYSLALRKTGAALSLPGIQVSLEFVNANRQAAIAAEEPLGGRSNYYIGNDPKRWITGVRQFGRVRYANVYSGIDLVWHANQQQPEYDLILRPGADPRNIRMQFHGADATTIADNGDLLLRAGGNELRQLLPSVWQQRGDERIRIDASYQLLAGGEVGVQVAKYDRSLPLTIDPVLSYSTFLGGTGATWAWAIAVDSAGNAYVGGYTSSDDFPGTTGVGMLFLAKLNASGTGAEYVTYFGGATATYPDNVVGIAVDSSGDAYATGRTAATDFPTTPGTLKPAKAGSDQDGFVLKFGPTGQIVWGTYIGGSTDDVSNAIAIDGSGNSYIAGYTDSNDFPTTSSPCNGIDPRCAFVATLSASGSALLNSMCLGEWAWATAIALDSQSNVYVIGIAGSNDLPTTQGVFQNSLNGGQDVFAAKLVSGSLAYLTYLGGSNSDWATSLAVDSGGNAYVAGYTMSSDFPTTAGALDPTKPQLVYGNAYTGFITKLNPGGTALVWSTYLGGSSSVQFAGIAVDVAGNAYVAGWTSAFDFPTTPGSIFGSSIGAQDIFVSQLSPDGSSLQYSGRIGARGIALARAFARDSNGALYIAGTVWDQYYPVTPDVYDSTPPAPAYNTGVVTKIDMASPVLCDVTLSPNSIELPFQGGTGSFDVNIANGCPWQAMPNNSLDSSTTLGPVYRGTSSATVSFTVAPNNSYQNTTMSIQVGPATYTITEDVEPCKPAFNPPSLNFANGGGIQSTYVTLPVGCARTAQSNNSWIQIVAGSNGSGSGSVSASAPTNMLAARSGSISISGHTVAVTQDEGPTPTLTLATVGSGMLTANPSAAGGAYFVGTRVCLTATPGAGYTLSSWSGTPLDASHCLTMNANASVTATFIPVKVTLTLSVSPSGSGTVTANAAAAGNLYAQGTKVCLTAKAKTGYYFLSWSGVTVDAQNCLILNANTTVKATFAKPFTLTVSVSPVASGTVLEKPSPTRGTYIPGTKVCLTPAAMAGSAFGSWSGTKLDASNCLVMTANASVTARFVKAYLLTLKVSPAGTGTVTALPSSPNRYYASGTQVCLTPTPKSGYAFKSWSGATLNASHCLSLKSNVTVTATFAKAP